MGQAGTQEPRITRILVPTDFSAPAEAAWRYALTFSKLFKSRVHVLHVVAEPYAYPWGSNEMSTLPMADYLSQAKQAARDRLKTFVAATTGQADRVRAATKVGAPVEEILEYAGAESIDLIVIGTHGRGLVGQMLLGSVAERVVRRAKMPVLMVHELPSPAKTTRATSSRAVRSRRATRKAG